jgi:3-hydroxyacyl-CoA dehydrogenase/enoyl-CoA hydratase/3-hydroxybutyryl-CoA epimerase
VLKDCDLVIEAVFEDRKVKAEETYRQGAGRAEARRDLRLQHLDAADQFAGREFKDQSKFIGIHFFSPVEKMMLVEIIVGKKTGPSRSRPRWIIVRAIRKTPIVVNDSAASSPRCVSALHPRRPLKC